MPGYATHLTWSATIGAGLGLIARVKYQAPLPEALFGGFLCALGGILPDIDSDKSKAHKRCMTAISGSSALLVACRLRDFMLRPETVLLISAFVFFTLYYAVGFLIQKFSSHRGMFHSVPFGVICGELIFIISTGSTQLRLFKAACIFFGVMIHLILDELASARIINTENSSSSRYGSSSYNDGAANYYGRGSTSTKKKRRSGSFGVKKSFGTALKLIDYKHLGSTIAFYAAAVVLGHMAMNVQSTLALIGEANVSELQGKAAVDRVRGLFPTQFDLSVVQWVAENELVLSPGADDNAKWRELEELLKVADANDPKEGSNTRDDASGRTSGVSLLDVVNWNSMNSSESN